MQPRMTIAALTLGVLLGVGGLAGCSPGGQTTTTGEHTAADANTIGSDGWITTKVKAELATTSGVSSTNISVDTKNGVVTLTGVLPTDVEVKKAVAAAQSVKDVRSVDSSGLKSSN